MSAAQFGIIVGSAMIGLGLGLPARNGWRPLRWMGCGLFLVGYGMAHL